MIITQAQPIQYDKRTDIRNPVGLPTHDRWVLKQIALHGKIVGDQLKGWAPYTHLMHVDINLVDGVHGYYHVAIKQ